jgi:DNA invertase Pin-like site-specific DNA recombinase
MGEKPQRAGIYTRLSYLDDGTEERCERQEDDCRRLADRLSWSISERHVFSDPARSAWQRNRKRPGWESLLAAIAAGQIDAVVIYHGDRLIRQPRDLEDLLDIAREKHVKLASPSGTRDLGNPDDQFILRIEAAQACKASDDSSRRIRRARTADAQKGLPRPGGTRPFGFERDNITHRAEEVKVIREAVDMLFAGARTYSVVKWVNERSTTTTGKRWRPNVFKDMLLRPRMAGLIERDGHLYEAAWEPVIDREVWEDLRALLEANGRRYSSYAPPVGESAVRYLLSGIARCDTCGATMNVQIGHNAGRAKRRTYLCSNTGCAYRVGISVPRLDAFVIGATLELLNDEDFVAGLSGGEDSSGAADINALMARKAEVEAQLRNLADHPNLRPDLLVASLESFDRRIEEIRGRMALSARRRLLLQYAGISRPKWDGLSLDVRRSIVAGAWRVSVRRAGYRGASFDPERVLLGPVEED